MLIGGMLCGLAAAAAQSVGYLVSSHFLRRRPPHARLTLIAFGHCWMGLFGLAMLPLVYVSAVSFRTLLPPLIGAVLFNLAGQFFFMRALQLAEPSRVTPLMTFKLFVPALVVSFVAQPTGQAIDRSLTTWQYLAVVLCVIAGYSINRAGGSMKRGALIAIACTTFVFAASDWCIGLSIAAVTRTGLITTLRAGLIVTSCAYIGTFFAIAPLLPRVRSRRGDLTATLPYAASWFVAMIFLFYSFGSLGIILGTIMQMTRGFMTMLLGLLLMYLGFAHIEPRQTRGVVAQRIVAGALMLAAISLYVIRDPKLFWSPAPKVVSSAAVSH